MLPLAEENPKFQKIVKTAEYLFSRFGFRRVTVEEICHKASVSKMTFYKYFPNKIELSKYVMEKIFKEALEKFEKVTAQQIPFTEKINQIIQLKMQYVDSYSEEFISDWLGNYPELQEFFEMKNEESLEWTMNFFRQAQERGEIRGNIRLEFLNYMLNKLLEISKDERSKQIFPNYAEFVQQLLNLFFYGIIPR